MVLREVIMKRSGLTFLAAATARGPVDVRAAAQDTKDKDGSPGEKRRKKLPTKEKLLTSGSLVGTLTKLDEDKKLTINVTYLEIDTGKVQGHQKFYLEQVAQINGIDRRNLAEIQRRVTQLQIDMAKAARTFTRNRIRTSTSRPKRTSKSVR